MTEKLKILIEDVIEGKVDCKTINEGRGTDINNPRIYINGIIKEIYKRWKERKLDTNNIIKYTSERTGRSIEHCIRVIISYELKNILKYNVNTVKNVTEEEVLSNLSFLINSKEGRKCISHYFKEINWMDIVNYLFNYDSEYNCNKKLIFTDEDQEIYFYRNNSRN